MLDVLLLLGVGAVVERPAALWWAYFDLVMLAAERRLSAAKGEERARLARDSYSYLHPPTVAGSVLGALGIKKTLAHVRDSLETTRPQRCAAALHSTSSGTTPSGRATSAA